MAGTQGVGQGLKGAISNMAELVQLTVMAANQTERLLAGAQGLNAITRQINLPGPGVSSRGGAGGGGSRVATPGETAILNRLTAWEQRGRLDNTINFRAGGWR